MRYKFLTAPSFLRQLKKLEHALQDEVYEKLELLKGRTNHKQLRVHALKGLYKGRYALSVNFRYRVIFKFGPAKDDISLLSVGDHDIYQ
mgnify:CR=1 FL=1